MKKGLIIVFGKDDIDFDNTIIFNVLNKQKVTICLVNNGNYNKVQQLLSSLKEVSDTNVFTLSLKKEKSLLSAVKAGVRSLINKDDFETIIYTSPKDINHKNYNTKFIEAFSNSFHKRKDKRVLLRTLYAIDEVKNKIKGVNSLFHL